jgi:hypothetical protein
VALVETDVTEESIASIIRVKRISGLNVLSWLIIFGVMMEAICSPETSALTRSTKCNIPEDEIFHSHRCENLKSYIELTCWAL